MIRQLLVGLWMLAVFATAGHAIDSVTIESGTLYLYGNKVPAPYTLVKTDSSILINGVQAWPHLSFEEASPSSIEVTPEVLAAHELLAHAGTLRRQWKEDGVSPELIRTQQLDFFESSEIVERVEEMGACLSVSFKAGFSVGVNLAPAIGSIPLEVQLEGNFMELQSYLINGSIVIISSLGRDLYVPARPAGPYNELLAELQAAVKADDFTSWDGKLSGPMAAEIRSPKPIETVQGR